MDLKQMNLEQKIGQMFFVGFHSKCFDRALKQLVEDYSIGNFVLFSRNIGSRNEIADLTSAIQENELRSTGIPAFISIDQEGGMVARIREDSAFFPGNMAFTAAGGDTFKEGVMCGEELKALGINMNLAPVLDVNNNPRNSVIGVRSYSDDERIVAEYGCRYIEGLQNAGVPAVCKHFPGHGDTAVDSHIDLPVVSKDMERIDKVELYPFKEAIKRGVDAIMTAHVLFPAIEPERLPATLSPNVLTGLLRGRFGFKGLILTDCMEMKAIASYYGTVEASVMAVKAGADMIFISHSSDLLVECLKALKKAVLSGAIPEARINESVDRILSYKKRYGLFQNPYPDKDKMMNNINTKAHAAFAGEVSLNSITLVKDTKKLLPVKGGRILAISPRAIVLNGADDSVASGYDFCEEVKRELGGEAFLIPQNPDWEVIGKALSLASSADMVIVGTYNAVFNKGQALLVEEVSRVCRNMAAVALRSPYDLTLFEGVSTCLCAYEYTQLSIKSIIKVLKGEKKPSGTLPVKIR